MKKVIVFGKNSFLGKKFIETTKKDISYYSYKEIDDIDFNKYDIVLNFSFNPAFYKNKYDQSKDFDKIILEKISSKNCHYIMISSRKVYGMHNHFDIKETDPINPSDYYGENKAIIENFVSKMNNYTIIRPSNIFGNEINRLSFFGIMLTNLKKKGIISFNMNPFTVKDFIFVNDFCKYIDLFIEKTPIGIYNLGSGYRTMIGELAMGVIQGYGSGDLICNSPKLSDQFSLNLEKLKKDIPSFEICNPVDVSIKIGYEL